MRMIFRGLIFESEFEVRFHRPGETRHLERSLVPVTQREVVGRIQQGRQPIVDDFRTCTHGKSRTVHRSRVVSTSRVFYSTSFARVPATRSLVFL